MAQNEERTMLKRKSKIVSFRASVHDESCATKNISLCYMLLIDNKLDKVLFVVGFFRNIFRLGGRLFIIGNALLLQCHLQMRQMILIARLPSDHLHRRLIKPLT